MPSTTAPTTTTGALFRLLAGSLLAALLGACGAALGAEASITFLPAAFSEGEEVTLRYAGVNSGAAINLIHTETTVGPLTRTVTRSIGTTVGKSGSATFTAPSARHAYRVEIRERCTEIFVFGDCGLLASAALPLLGPVVSAPASAFAGETVRVRWDRMPVGSELRWYLGLPSVYDRIGGWRDAGRIDTASGSRDVRVPGGRASVHIGAYACTTSFFGRSCNTLLTGTTITLRDPEMTVLPSAVDPGGVVSIAYEYAPVNAEIFVMYVPHWGPLARPNSERIAVVTSPGAGTGYDPDVTASGRATFRITGARIPTHVEMWTPCHGLCGFAGIDARRMVASAPLSLAPTELLVSPDPVLVGGEAVITWSNAPAGSVVRRTTAMWGSAEFASIGTRSGSTSVRLRSLEAGDYQLHLHLSCGYIAPFVFRCSDTLASATLRVRTEEEELSRSAAPTVVVAGRPSLAAPSAHATAPSALSASPSPIPTAEPTIAVSAAPIIAIAPTPTPTPVVASVAPPQAPARTFAPSPTPAPTLAITPSPIVTARPVPTAQPTAAPTKTPTPTQQPTASPTPKPNSAPKIGSIGDRSGKAGQKFVIGVSASDVDGDKITLGCSGADKFTDYGNGSGSFEWSATKAGKYTFKCTASDGKLSSSTTFAITVS